MGKILFGLLLSNLLYSYTQASAFPERTIESFIIHYLEDKRIVPVRIELDSKQQTEHVLSSRGGETLYDFNRGKVAYKDTNSSQCFIADISEESLEGDRKRIRNLRNGIVRGFYLPTFIIEEELIDETQHLNRFGDRLTQFCDGNTVSVVKKQHHRRKRDASEEKGQFTHHSYGHYGHQSNNYAHYGHETYVTGSLDKDGQAVNQRVSHQQVRSESSSGYPGQSSWNGPQLSTADFSSPQLQTQYQMPAYRQTLDGNGRSFGTGGSGQFSLQTAQESGYQLNLPLGLRAGNTYRGGIRSAGQYGVGGLHPQITTEYQKYPGSMHSEIYRPGDQRSLGQISPRVSSIPEVTYPSTTPVRTPEIRGRTVLPGYHDSDQTTLTHKLPGMGLEKVPIVTHPISPITTGEQRVEAPTMVRGKETSDFRTDSKTFIPSGQTQISDVSRDQTTSGHRIPQRIDHSGLQTTYPGHGMQLPGILSPIYQPGITVPSIHAPETKDFSRGTTIPGTGISEPGIQTPVFHPGHGKPSILRPGIPVPTHPGIPGQIPTGIDIPGPETTGLQTMTGITKLSHQIPGIHPELSHRQQYIPSSRTSRQQFLQPPGGINGDSGTRTQFPDLRPPATIPGHPHSDRRDLAHTSHPGITQYPDLRPPPTIPGQPHSDRRDLTRTSHPGLTHSQRPSARNGLQYPDSSYHQTAQRGEYPGGSIPPQVSGITGDSRGRPDDAQFLQRGVGPEQSRGYQMPTFRPGLGETVPESIIRDSRGATSTLITPGDRRIATDQFGHGSTRLYSQDSAASQTQIQTGLEGTAAEASSAGQYRGLGSQTQVQGGYAGNGSFSAQAQSGFTGGVVQSQVQGSKLGGLSGSSAQVEHVGSAQSQVQVGQPSGAASGTAQGRFSGGITQVQAQSGKTGGSAGAQAQSTGLSSSHVQVNIGGNDVSQRERFQGTVSASVQGGHSSGQSQTQLQGGYESGRTYVATAQGGFDSSAPPVPRFSNHTLRIGQPSGAVSGLHTVSGRPALRRPPESDLDGKQISETTGLQSRDQIGQTAHTHSVPQPDQRHPYSGGLPQRQFPAEVSSQRTLYPPPSQSQYIPGSRVQYPSLISETQRPSHTFPSPQITRYPYPGYPTDVRGTSTGTVDEKQISENSRIPGFRGYDQSGILPSDLTPGSPRVRTSEIPGYQGGAIQPSTYLPGSIRLEGQEGHVRGPGYIPSLRSEGARDISHPPSWDRTDQQYNDTAVSLPSYPDLSQQQPGTFSQIPYSPTLGSRHIPSYPSSLVPSLQRPGMTTDQITGFQPSSIPGLQKHYPIPSLYSGQHPILPPSLQTTPSQVRPGELPVLMRPDAVPHMGLQPPPSPHIGTQQPDQIRPEITQRVSSPGVTPTGRPGVTEPDTRNCCEALRDLKRRCCGRTSETDEGSSCCKSASSDEIFDFSSEDDDSKREEPCKIVKAICYIVYKPVGKARVCKPTQTNGC